MFGVGIGARNDIPIFVVRIVYGKNINLGDLASLGVIKIVNAVASKSIYKKFIFL